MDGYIEGIPDLDILTATYGPLWCGRVRTYILPVELQTAGRTPDDPIQIWTILGLMSLKRYCFIVDYNHKLALFYN